MLRKKMSDKSRTSIMKRLKNDRYLLFMLSFGFILYIVFKWVPILGSIIAFKDYTFSGGLLGSEWVGLKHFRALLTMPDVIKVIKNTVVISLLKLLFGFPAPILLALLINEVSNKKFKKITQTISYLPHFFSWVVISGLLMTVLSPSTGIINKIIVAFSGKPIYFLANQKTFVPVLVISDIWKEIGWGSIIYLAALTGISSELYEVAMIDGAGRIRRIISITIPGLLPTVAIMLIMNAGNILNAGFDQIFNLYNPSVYDVADIIDTYTYRVGIGSYEYSFATAVSLFKSIAGMIMVFTANTLAKKMSDGEIALY